MRLAQSRLGLDPPGIRTTPPRGALDPSTPAGVLHLQRTAGNRAATALIARLPYQTTYSESQVRRILNQSEGRVSPTSGAEGIRGSTPGGSRRRSSTPRRRGKTKSVFANTEQQDKAVKDVLASAAGQAQLALLDAAPAAPSRQMISEVDAGHGRPHREGQEEGEADRRARAPAGPGPALPRR
jgi:hypothetical protein